ncbi:hypothetical protein MTR67_026007 [Solanum verrucosum]|uniref:F-box domain-containing protein n=1 Tax=Solanum verrucosum TaxID=315347 RepID=A0AAF0QY56_SOLVR|nr:hypothetical protein MTR67_026007 [Solanum verrucosum]
MEGRHSHPSTPIPDYFVQKRGKKRGSYNCGRCGLPKKGHVCDLTKEFNEVPTPTSSDAKSFVLPSPLSVVRTKPTPPLPPPRQAVPQLRRALSFDDIGVTDESPGSDDDEGESEGEGEGEFLDFESELDLGRSGKLPANCLWEVFKRLPPSSLLSSAKVCKGWRDVSRRIWKSAEELRLEVPVKAQIGLVGSVLQKCPGLVKLSLRMKSDVDATMLACIAFSCPNLDSLEILTSETSVNRITGWKSHCGFVVNLLIQVFNCPNLKEISLIFSRQENENTDLTAMVNGLGRSCPRLQNIHVASVRLTHAVVLALTAANLRGLRMLSLVLGSEITDASVAAIASSYSRLELLDLSGSSISDSGIGMICNVFPETLLKLLLALCPNITSSGIQFAAAQLPNLELMDCGMSICDPDLDSPA